MSKISHIYCKCHHPKFLHLDKKNKVDYLQTKLSGASQQLSTFPFKAVVQHIIQLAHTTCAVYTVLCGDMSQLHAIHIIWSIAVAVDSTI